MEPELKLYQQLHTKLKKYPRDVQIRTLAWVSNKLREEQEALDAKALIEPPTTE